MSMFDHTNAVRADASGRPDGPAGVQHDSQDMVTIPAGSFRIGSDASPDESPVRLVTLGAFAIDRFPVDNRRFARFVADGGYRRPSLWTPEGWELVRANAIEAPNYWHDPVWAGQPDVPVTGISWWEALAFARWAGKALPTEAQWEGACRGPEHSTYPWGEARPEPRMANYAPECEPLDRVPTRPADYPENVSGYGCRDMAGNFAEWCLDNYTPGYHEVGVLDPVYVTRESDSHVVRGGCGLHDEDYLRCSARDHYHPGLRDNLVGFRCARPLGREDS